MISGDFSDIINFNVKMDNFGGDYHMVIGDDMVKTLITNAEKLNYLNDEDIAFEKGPKSTMGKRKAYE